MITVQPIRFTPHQDAWHRLAPAARFPAGLPPDQQWSEFDGRGILAIHQATAGDDHAGSTDLHLLVDDLDALAELLTRAGLGPSVVDEAYDRTLLVGTPDGDQLWVDGQMDDLHGYARLDT